MQWSLKIVCRKLTPRARLIVLWRTGPLRHWALESGLQQLSKATWSVDMRKIQPLTASSRIQLILKKSIWLSSRREKLKEGEKDGTLRVYFKDNAKLPDL